jgi:hypothetical protein
MTYYDTLIEVADDCLAVKGQVPQARGGKKTKAVVEYELLVKHPSHTPKKTLRLRCTPFSMTSRRPAGATRTREVLEQGPPAAAVAHAL